MSWLAASQAARASEQEAQSGYRARNWTNWHWRTSEREEGATKAASKRSRKHKQGTLSGQVLKSISALEEKMASMLAALEEKSDKRFDSISSSLTQQISQVQYAVYSYGEWQGWQTSVASRQPEVDDSMRTETTASRKAAAMESGSKSQSKKNTSASSNLAQEEAQSISQRLQKCEVMLLQSGAKRAERDIKLELLVTDFKKLDTRLEESEKGWKKREHLVQTLNARIYELEERDELRKEAAEAKLEELEEAMEEYTSGKADLEERTHECEEKLLNVEQFRDEAMKRKICLDEDVQQLKENVDRIIIVMKGKEESDRQWFEAAMEKGLHASLKGIMLPIDERFQKLEKKVAKNKA